MNIEIGEVSSTVHTVDSDLPLSANAMQRLARHLAKAMSEDQSRQKRCESERRITGGVVAERDEESGND